MLFIADRPGEAAQSALDLHAMLAADEAVPELRVGLASGRASIGWATSSDTVNLASRLTAFAAPGTVLSDAGTAAAARAAGGARPRAMAALGPRAGVVEPWLLARTPGG